MVELSYFDLEEWEQLHESEDSRDITHQLLIEIAFQLKRIADSIDNREPKEEIEKEFAIKEFE